MNAIAHSIGDNHVAQILLQKNDEQSLTVITHEIKDSIVEQRRKDGYINATALAKAYKLATGKRRDVSEWLSNRRTKETLQHLSLKTGIPVIELYQVFQGSPDLGGGTWIHPLLAIRFGIWLSDEFGYTIEEWVRQWETIQNPQVTVLAARVTELEQKLATALNAIALLTENFNKISRALPTRADYMPPGWNPHNWERLSPQEKRHFRYLWKRRGFRPSDQNLDELKALPMSTQQQINEQVKQQQRSEMEAVVGEVSESEKQRIEGLKLQMFERLNREGNEEF